MHGLANGIPKGHLTDFIPGVHPDKLILKGYKNWPEYERRFGYCSIDNIKNKEKVSKYILKYISKNIDKSVKELGAHMYYCSQGLKTAQEITRGMFQGDYKPDFENEYVEVKWFGSEQFLENIT
jgi:hypothetical protein